MEVKVERDILIYAFRYALGRMTYAVHDVVISIKRNWGILSKGDQELIHKEIKEAIERKRAGMDMDIKEWQSILKLPIMG